MGVTVKRLRVAVKRGTEGAKEQVGGASTVGGLRVLEEEGEGPKGA